MQRGRYGKTTVGVLTVIQQEFDAVKAALGATEQRRGTRYWYGGSGQDRFVLTKMADRGNTPAGEATRDLIEHWRPDVVMLVGIGGALSSGDAGLGDVVVPDFLHYGEFRKLTEAGDDLRFAAYDHPTVGLRSDVVEGVRERGAWTGNVSEERPEHAEGERHGSDPDKLKVEFGGLVAGEKIMGDPDHPEQERLFVTFEHAIAVDMESWGVGRAVHHARNEPDYNPRLIVIRGISDMIERRRPASDGGEPGAGQGEPEGEADVVTLLPSGVTTVNVNDDQRRRWKRYAAATAAAFADAVVEDLCDAA
jgi:nucleoside phosphorylase